jgi:hypothetical protein
MGHVTAPELPCARWQKLAPWDTWQHLSRDSGARVTGHVAAPELPRARR